MKASAKGITGTIDGYHGEMWDFRGGLDFLFTENVGLGALYQYTTMKFSRSGTAAELTLDYKYSGPLGYVIFAF